VNEPRWISLHALAVDQLGVPLTHVGALSDHHLDVDTLAAVDRLQPE
jgi:hypothetical protein